MSERRPVSPFLAVVLTVALNAAALSVIFAQTTSEAETDSPKDAKPAAAVPETAAPVPAPAPASAAKSDPTKAGGEALKIDFSADATGDLPSDYMVSDAEARFTIEEDAGNKLLRMSPSPIVDGGVLVGKSVKGGATVTARIRATAKRRSFPRFGVGLHGVSGYRLLAAPADKELQLMKDDAVVAKAPLEWKSGTWAHFELSLSPSAEGGSAMEGRLWEEGQARPAAPQLTFAVKTPPGTGKASVWAAPYSELPVDFDDITVAARP